MFGLAGWSLKNLIAQIESASTEQLAERFWNDWCRGHVPGREAIWITAFWKSPHNAEIYDFYSSQALHERMSALALDGEADPELAAKAFAVASVIEASTSSS